MTGYFVSAAIGKLEVFDLMVVTGEPVVNGNSVTAADRYSQAVACFAQQHVGSRNTFAELQGIVTAFVLDGVATVTFIEEVGIVAGTADQDIVADAAVEVVVTVFTNQAVIACQAVQVVVAGVTVDVVVQSVTGTVEVAGTLQEQVFNVVGQGVVDYAANSIDTAAGITVLDNLVAFVVNKVNIVTVTTTHDVSVGTTVQVVVAFTALQVVFTTFTVQGVTVVTALQGIVTVATVNYVGTVAAINHVFATCTVNGVFLIGTDSFGCTVLIFVAFVNTDDVTRIFVVMSVGIVLVLIVNAIFAVFIVGFRLRFWLWFRLRLWLRLRLGFRLRLRLWLRLRLGLWVGLRLWFWLNRWAVRINMLRRNRFWSRFRVIRFTRVAVEIDDDAFVRRFRRRAVGAMTEFAVRHFEAV